MMDPGKQKPLVGVSLMLEPEFASASLPLFENEEIEIAEWSFDMLWTDRPCPDWMDAVLDTYAEAGRLLGHGVTYSMFTAGADGRADEWCRKLRSECECRKYRHITEHFGFMLGGDFHRGAPLPMPFLPEILELGRLRLAALSVSAGAPIGLENLAFAFCERDVREQGNFLRALLSPIDGFVLLDLHNIYCQSFNFGVPAEQLIAGYPLELVKELHLSGGSWSEAAGVTVRRDTHDNPVPSELFPLLKFALKECPKVEAVILEQLGNTLAGSDAQASFRSDFRKIADIVHEHS